jgi:hypothetical protein
MAYVVSALTDYTKENEDKLVLRSLFGSKSLDLFRSEGNVLTGVKSSEKINILETDAIFQSGTACGFLTSGSTTFTQRTVTVGKIKVNESLCPKALEAKYTQKALQAGSRYENIPFEQQYTDHKAGTIAEQLEVAVWRGDTSAVNANLSKFDGLIKLIDAAGTAVAANVAAYIATPVTTSAGITVANVKALVAGMWLSLPASVQGKSDVRVFCGWDTFNKYIAAFTDANLFAFSPKGNEVSAENGEVMIHGTNYKLTAVHGLDGTDRLFAMRTSNVHLGTDLENEEERWEIFFAKEADEIRFIAEFKYGVNVAFPSEISQFTKV